MRKTGINHKKPEKILYYPKKNYRTIVRILKLLAKSDMLTTQQIAKMLGKRWAYPHKRTKDIMKDLASFGYCQNYGVVSNKEHLCEFCKKCFAYLVSHNSIEKAIEILEKNKIAREKAKKEKGYEPKKFFHCREGYVLGRLVWRTCRNCGSHVDSYKDLEYKINQDQYWLLTDLGLLAVLVILKGNNQFEFIKKKTGNKIFKMIYFLLRNNKKDHVQRLILAIKDLFKIKPNIFKVVDEWYDEMIGVILGIKNSQDPDFNKFQQEIKIEDLQNRLMSARSGR